MAEKLTPEQERAVHDRGGKLLVSAAAGSGKTKVLVDRLLDYVLDHRDPADLDDFLIITYTKAAAAELRGKIGAKLSEKIAQAPENRHLQQQIQRLYLAKISTVHAFCGDILREYAYLMDISGDFRVGDENECRDLRAQAMEQVLDEAYEGLGDDPDFQAFVDTQGLGRNDKLVPEILMKVYDSARCHLDPERWLEKGLAWGRVEDITDAAQTPWGRYLMEDLFDYLDLQIPALEECVRLAESQEGWEKAAANLRDTRNQLKELRESRTWEELVRRRRIDYGRLIFPKKYGDPELAERIKAVRSSCKEGLAKKLAAFASGNEQVLADLGQVSAALRGLTALVKAFGSTYDRRKRSHHVLDFGDLEHKTLDLLLGSSRSGPTQAAGEIGRRFREILVDEYQDSNAVQDAIFDALTREKQNLFLVGDVKQSIYQFRLADPGIFLEKYAAFVPAGEAEPRQGRKVLLSSNFRSGGGVIAGVNDVFRACMSPKIGGLRYGEGEALREGIPHIPLDEPEVELHAIPVRENTYDEEAAFTAQRIEELLSGNHMVREGDSLRPIRREDIVILLRSPGSVGLRFQAALEARGIRCTTGGGSDLLQAEEIGVLRAILQTIGNPRQDIPLLAALASPVFGFTADALAAIRGSCRAGSFYDALCQSESEKAVEFVRTLSALREEARLYTLAQLLERVFLRTGMVGVYAAMSDGEVREANLQSFFQLTVDFEAKGRRDLPQFLEHLETLAETGLASAGESGSTGAVSIMSIHKSKGLEFPVVFLCGLSKGFNRESLRSQVLCHQELGLGLSCVNRETRVRYPSIAKRAIAVKTMADELSEELRVLYVAMTRARDRLIMTYASNSLEKDLADIALRMDMGSRELITGGVSNLGQWVLLAALERTEAGELFALGGRPDKTRLGNPPWKITVSEAPQPEKNFGTQAEGKQPLPPDTVERLAQALAFRYGHTPATLAPSKQTATQRKGRWKDEEAAEQAKEPAGTPRAWRKPRFLEPDRQGKTYGSAIHAALQYIRYSACGSREAVEAEITRLVAERYLTPEQGALIPRGKLARFFATELGEKLRTGENVLREFKFSILDDGRDYGPGLEGEQVLLQGVVDCALLEPEGITVVDFKTDFVTEETLPAVTDRYRPQVAAYAQALRRIYGLEIKEAALYFFHLERLVPVK